MSRRLLAIGVLALLALTAGCTGLFGGGEVDRSAAGEEETYDWNTTANTTLTVERDRILAVYDVEDRSTIEIYAFQRFNNERPVDPVAVQFRYPNGTVVGPEAMAFSRANSHTVVELPAEEGQVALTLPKSGKRVRVPVVVEGSHEVILPEDAHVRYFLLGRVAPRADAQAEEADGRVHLRWNDVTQERIVVEYYLERDLVIFTVILTLGSVLLVGRLVYFCPQLRTLRERRDEVAVEDDSGAS
jgi:hypothetical protein